MSQQKTNACLESISLLHSKRTIISEKMLAHITELAEVLCDEASDDEIFFRDEPFINRYKSLTATYQTASIPGFNQNEVSNQEKYLSFTEKAFLCMNICNILGIKGIMNAGTFFDGLTDDTSSTVCCVKSPTCDEAYLTFTSDMQSPRVFYADDFTEACESVYYGRTDYCILPVASSADGRLAGFRNLALKYGLKTVKRCRVMSSDNGFTVFALMKKELSIPESADNAYFEFMLKNQNCPSELLCVADACGMEILSVDITPERDGTLDIALKISDEGFCGFLSYLHLTFPDFIPLGIFTEI